MCPRTSGDSRWRLQKQNGTACGAVRGEGASVSRALATQLRIFVIERLTSWFLVATGVRMFKIVRLLGFEEGEL